MTLNSETLIALVHVHPELWDTGNPNYLKKIETLQAWLSIAEKLGVTVEAAKARWSSLRHMFWRVLRKKVKESGDPNAHEPIWRHYKSMLYLKDRMAKDANGFQYDESLYPQTILEVKSCAKIEDDSFLDDSNSNTSYQERTILPSSSKKRTQDRNEDHNHISIKRHHWDMGGHGNYEDYTSTPPNEMDEDYHFVMSILPSVRRLRQDRKTYFRMKIFQLIMDEDKVESSERT